MLMMKMAAGVACVGALAGVAGHAITPFPGVELSAREHTNVTSDCIVNQGSGNVTRDPELTGPGQTERK